MQKQYSICAQFQWDGHISDKAADVMRMFGVSIDRLKNQPRKHTCENLVIKPGDIIYITGASGAGKSVLLKQLYKKYDCPKKINLDNIDLPDEKLVIDCIDGDHINSLRFLSKAGISDVFDVLNHPVNLSEGQKYRFRLACALSSTADTIFADEFCSNLDRLTAATVAYKIANLARKHAKTLILASSHDDIIRHLNPDITIIKYFSMPTQLIYADKN